MKIDLTTLPKDIYNILTIIGETADKLNYECYVVGGFVRDFFLKIPNDDIDFVVVGSGTKIAEEVSKLPNAGKFSIYENYGTAKVDYNGYELEFVGARKEFYHRESRNPIVENGTIQDDMDRRDLTVNDMAIRVNKKYFGELFDPHNGYKDLQNKILRTPLEPNITYSDDPLRMLRTIRFAGKLGFQIDFNTIEGIKENKNRINIITQERITEELRKMILSKYAAYSFYLLDITGLMEIILPEIYDYSYFYNVERLNVDEWAKWAYALFYMTPQQITDFFKRIGLPLDYRLKKTIILATNFTLLTKEVNINNYNITNIRQIMFNTGKYFNELIKITNNLYNEKLLNITDEIDKQLHLTDFIEPLSGDDIMNIFNLKPSKEIANIKNFIIDGIIQGKILNNKNDAINYIKTTYYANKK